MTGKIIAIKNIDIIDLPIYYITSTFNNESWFETVINSVLIIAFYFELIYIPYWFFSFFAKSKYLKENSIKNNECKSEIKYSLPTFKRILFLLYSIQSIF